MGIVASLKQKLFRWQSDGTAPLRLGQRRIFILPTRSGLLFALTLIVMLLGAINYTLALGHALVFLLTGLGLTGMVHTFRNLHGLVVTPERSEPVFVGEVAHFRISLRNDRSSPRLALELEAEAEKTVFATVDGEKSTKINIPLSAQQRGWLVLPRIRLSTRYPLGFFVAWSYLQPSMHCLVYPQPILTPLPGESATPHAGERHGDGGQEDFAGFRERQPADSPRHVAWKASARDTAERALLIKQFAGGAEVQLQLDWDLTDSNMATETRLSILTGWVLAAEAARLSYGLRLPGQEIASQQGENHQRLCLEALALFSA